MHFNALVMLHSDIIHYQLYFVYLYPPIGLGFFKNRNYVLYFYSGEEVERNTHIFYAYYVIRTVLGALYTLLNPFNNLTKYVVLTLLTDV